MKKLLYLLFAICLIGCSDDDDNASAQTFLEKYDGVIWEREDYLSGDTSQYIILYDSNQFITTVSTDEGIDCISNKVGGNPNGDIMTIKKNEENKFIVEVVETNDDDDGLMETYLTTFEVNSNILKITWSNDDGFTNLIRTSIANPCN